MQSTFTYQTYTMISVLAFVGIVAIGTRIYWFFNKKAHKRGLAELRKRLEEMQPTDPQYNQVRALYMSMQLDAHRSHMSDAHDTVVEGSHFSGHEAGHTEASGGTDNN